jgi:ABC-2 type transport system permease protein
MNQTSSIAPARALNFSQMPSLNALIALFLLTLRRTVRGRRLIILSVLFLLPSCLILLIVMSSNHKPHLNDLQFSMIFNIFPHALVPLASLLYAIGMVQDDLEEQTLTYLLVRPVPRWLIYLTKLFATMLVTSTVIAFFTLFTFTTMYIALNAKFDSNFFMLAAKTVGLFTLCQIGYCGVFALLGMFTRRALIAGVAYIFILEGVLGSMDMIFRWGTIIFYFRVLVLRLNEQIMAPDWSINMKTAPEISTCIFTLLGIGVVLAIIGAIFFTYKEFRMKTPE